MKLPTTTRLFLFFSTITITPIVNAFGSSSTAPNSHLRMDMGEAGAFVRGMPKVSPVPSTLTIPHNIHNQYVLDQAQQAIGMPWSSSEEEKQELTFMPFWNHQISIMKQSLTNLQPLSTTNKDQSRDFSHATSPKGTHRVANLAFASDEFRKIRMTYYDGGSQVQVYNSLWYPRACRGDGDVMPVLGIDLLQFQGGKKHLVVVDFQPLSSSDNNEGAPPSHEADMERIRSKYPLLQGKMSNRFYNENEFFSNQMLFSRLEDIGDNQSAQECMESILTPAYQEYMQLYIDLVLKNTQKKSDESSSSSDNEQYTMERQQAYDVYSAARDPAIHMFTSQFGKEWADEYVHEFLFDQSR